MITSHNSERYIYAAFEKGRMMIDKLRLKTAVLTFLMAAFLLSGCVPEAESADTVVSGTDTSLLLEEQGMVQDEDDALQEKQEGQGDITSGKELTVTFLDVGQGNAVLAEYDGAYMLIDGGDRDYSSYVVSYLQKEGVEELDYIISSHYDADHLNGVIGALHAFSCGTLLAADYTTDTKVYQSLLSVVDEKDIQMEYPKLGDTYTFGEAAFTIVCPDAYDYSQDNDNSIGIRIEYGDSSFLICGDAGEKVEEMMIQSGLTIASDVYLASHHGSSNSTSIDFLEAVEPQAVVFSVGMGNSYGHPTASVIENVISNGAEIYRTDLQGTIVVTSNGKDLSWNVEPSLDVRSGDELQGKLQEQQDIIEKTKIPDENTEDMAIYILNRNTKKFHLPSCSSASTIVEDNRAEFEGLRDELLESGYTSCKRCNP